MRKENNGKMQELSSRVVKAGHRVYFVDAKQDRNGSKFISLSECKSATPGGGGRDRQRIHIYEEDFGKVIAALNEAFAALGYSVAITPTDTLSADPVSARAIEELNIPSLDEMLAETDESLDE